MNAELCEDCIKMRTAIHQHGREVPDIGLLMCGTWQDITPLTVIQGNTRINVSVKFLIDGENAGIVRLRFDDKPKWFAAGVFGNSPLFALSEAKHFLRNFYFPDSPIRFE